MDNSVDQKIARRFHLLAILSFITVVLSIFSTFLIVRLSLISVFDRRERKARDFLEAVVDSIYQNTEYYKLHCSKDELAEIEKYINEITNNYKITTIDSEWAYYEFDLTFDGKNKLC